MVLAGDHNVMATDLDAHKPERWVDDALLSPEVREAFRQLVDHGWIDALRELQPGERIYTFWDYLRKAYSRDAGWIDPLLLMPSIPRTIARRQCRSSRPRLGKDERPRPNLDRPRQ